MKTWTNEINELEILFKSLKGFIPDLEKELERLIKADDENMALVYSRRCLEVIVTDLCESELKRPRKTEPLKGIIDKLNHEEKVPAHIITSMLNLNSLSTFGAHPKEFDPQQVRLVLINLSTIINWYLKYKNIPDKISEEKTGPVISEEIRESAPAGKQLKKSIIIIPAILFLGAILIFALDIFNIFRKDKFKEIRDPEGKISIAVMPFENLTGDSSLYFWQNGISEFLINGLGNSEELAVTSSRVISEVFESSGKIYTASISPSLARETARKVKAGTYITGNFIGNGNNVSIMVNLVNTSTDKLIWSNKIDGDLENNYRYLLDSLSGLVKNFLEIKAIEEKSDYDMVNAFPNSARAYRYYIDGLNAIIKMDSKAAIPSLLKAIEIDSGFTFAYFYLAWATWDAEKWEETPQYVRKSYELKKNLPSRYHPWIDLWYACLISENQSDIYKYCDQLEKSGINSRFLLYDLGVTYESFLDEYSKAIIAFEKVMKLSQDWGGNWAYDNFYRFYVWTLHRVGRHEEEKKISDIGFSINPDNGWLIYYRAVCAVSRGDSIAAEMAIKNAIASMKKYNYSESIIEHVLGSIYYDARDSIKAEEHYRNAYNLEKNNPWRNYFLAMVLINFNINVDEGMKLVQYALEIEPDDNTILWLEGTALYKSGKYEEALAFFKKARENYIGVPPSLIKDIAKAEQALTNQNK